MRSFLTLALALLACLRVCSSQYLIGTGISDVTGPAAEVNLMGKCTSLSPKN